MPEGQKFKCRKDLEMLWVVLHDLFSWALALVDSA